MVVGGGEMASARVRRLLAAGARVTVIAREAGTSLRRLAESGAITLHTREFVTSDIGPAYFIVIGATDDPETQSRLAREAERHRLLYNVVDSIDRCNFFTPAVVERGDLQIAISTNGHSPVLARRLREAIEAALPETAASWLEQLGELRLGLKLHIPASIETRKRIIEQVIEETLAHERS